MFRKLKCSENRFNDYEFKIHIDRHNFNDCIVNDCLSNKKVWISSTYKSNVSDLFIKLITTCYNEDNECIYNKNILFVSGNGLCYYSTENPNKSFITLDLIEYIIEEEINENGDTDHTKQLKNINNKFLQLIDGLHIPKMEKDENNKLKDSLLYDLENQLVNLYDVNICLTTPTITSGISINQPIFNTTYNYGGNKSVSVREFIQMLFRNRQLTDKQINIYLTGKYNQYINETELHTIKHYIQYVLKNQNELTISKLLIEDNEYTDKQDKLYMDCRNINKKECYNSLQLFNQLFFHYLINIHKFNNIKFVDIKNDNTIKDTKQSLTEIKQNREQIKINKFMDTEIMELNDDIVNEYKELSNSEDSNLTDIKYRQLQKYNTLTSFFKYECIIMYYYFKELVNEYGKEDVNGNIKDIDSDIDMYKELKPFIKLLYDKPLLETLLQKYKSIYDTYINNVNHIEEYGLHTNSSIKDKYHMISEIIKLEDTEYLDDKEYDNEYNKDTIPNVERNIISGLLKYLHINIKDIDSKEYHYINETSNKHKLTGIRDELMNSIQSINNVDTTFIDFINDYVLVKITTLSNELKLKNTNRLQPTKNNDYKDLMKIIKHYLLKINLIIEYETTQYFYKTTKLTIKQQDTNILLSHKKMNINYFMEEDGRVRDEPIKRNRLNELVKPYDIVIENDTLEEEIDNTIHYFNDNEMEEVKYGKSIRYIRNKDKKKRYIREEVITHIKTGYKLKINLNGYDNQLNQNKYNAGIYGTTEKKKIYQYRLVKSKRHKVIDHLSKMIQYIDEDSKKMDIDMYNNKNHKCSNDDVCRELFKKIHTNTQPIVSYRKNDIIYNVWNDIVHSIYDTTIDREKYNEYLDIDECMID